MSEEEARVLDVADWPWLADQLEAWPEKRVHPDRTMSIASLHRMAAAVIRQAAQREAAIIKWLRGEVQTDYTDPQFDIGANLADAIERGDHR